MTAQGLARQAIWNSMALVAQLTASVSIAAVAFRRLPAGDVGHYALAVSAIGLFAVLDPAIGYRITTIVAKCRAQGGSMPAQAAGRDHGTQRGLSTVAYIVAASDATASAVLWGLLESHSRQIMLMWTLMTLGFCIQIATATYPAATMGLGNYHTVAQGSILFGSTALLTAITTMGIIGPAALGAAQLAGQAGNRLYLGSRLRGQGRNRLLVRPSLTEMCRVVRLAGPMYVTGVSAQLLPFGHLWIIGAASGAAPVAHYRAGTMFPTQGSSLLYRLYDVVFPRLSQVSDLIRQQHAVRLTTRVFCAAAGVLYGAGFVLRHDLVMLLLGRHNEVAADVLGLFCVILLVNVSTHGLSLLLIARSQHSVLLRVVIWEAAGNLALAAILAATRGPIGPAWATLFTMMVSNIIILPLVARSEIEGAPGIVLSGALRGVLGAALAVTVLTPVHSATNDALGVALVSSLALTLAIIFVYLTVGPPGRRALVLSLKGVSPTR